MTILSCPIACVCIGIKLYSNRILLAFRASLAYNSLLQSVHLVHGPDHVPLGCEDQILVLN